MPTVEDAKTRMEAALVPYTTLFRSVNSRQFEREKLLLPFWTRSVSKPMDRRCR